MISVGIDVHKKRCQTCLKDEKGRLIEELSFQNNPEGISQIRPLLATYPEAKVALESTGNLWTRIYDELHKEPPEGHLGQPIQGPNNRRGQNQERQNGRQSPSRPSESRLGRGKLRPRRGDTRAESPPSQRQSADHTFHGHITRQGNKYIRWIVIEAAQHASRFDSQLKPFYERIAARRGRQRAIVAVARKLLIYIYQVLIKQEPYRAQRNDLLEKKLKRLQHKAQSSLQAN